MSKIKICGLFRSEDIEYVNEARPDYVGFVFAPGRRRIAPAQAAAFRKSLRPGIAPVGVFVNAPIDEIAALYRDGVIHLAQLHGGEDAAYIERLKAACGVPIIKVVKIARHSRRSEESQPLTLCLADYLLFDSGNGSGKTFDWNLIPRTGKPYFLAGGIGLGNIGDALALSPYALDVSSGAETNGLKDREKILQLVAACRAGIDLLRN
ncbi:MAG: phosphoribosylanthranilate isomerase [Clostridiales bacterium]|jgi:phosphoribosylanthranilate isomerase|nr:phosphoribosylanthranilate isomerase [Clostridiales bacterium]